MIKIPCAIYRGGTSKPIFFMEEELPKDPNKRDRMVLEAFGSPDMRQIDGLGGADPLTSKVAYIGAPTVPDTDMPSSIIPAIAAIHRPRWAPLRFSAI